MTDQPVRSDLSMSSTSKATRYSASGMPVRRSSTRALSASVRKTTAPSTILKFTGRIMGPYRPVNPIRPTSDPAASRSDSSSESCSTMDSMRQSYPPDRAIPAAPAGQTTKVPPLVTPIPAYGSQVTSLT